MTRLTSQPISIPIHKWWVYKSTMVQLTSKLTLVCEDTCVFFYFCLVTQSELACDMRANFHVKHASYILCAAQDPSSCAA